MKITIIQIGKTKHDFFKEAEQEYLKRLHPYTKIEIITLKESVLPAGGALSGREIVKEKEALEILKNLPQKSFLIALDEKGKSMTSLKFAEFLRQKKDFGQADVTFIIGGPYGLSPKVLEKAQLKLSFSEFTFTHEMIRVLLVEQLYRAFTILQGKTYHY
jgi:23S rRNA (pseudouridine1915-N3)-methyltransferase